MCIKRVSESNLPQYFWCSMIWVNLDHWHWSRSFQKNAPFRHGSRILKWGVNFCNNVIEPKPGWGIRKKKKGAQKQGGENSPISPPLDLRLPLMSMRAVSSVMCNATIHAYFPPGIIPKCDMFCKVCSSVLLCWIPIIAFMGKFI